MATASFGAVAMSVCLKLYKRLWRLSSAHASAGGRRETVRCDGWPVAEKGAMQNGHPQHAFFLFALFTISGVPPGGSPCPHEGGGHTVGVQGVRPAGQAVGMAQAGVAPGAGAVEQYGLPVKVSTPAGPVRTASGSAIGPANRTRNTALPFHGCIALLPSSAYSTTSHQRPSLERK